MLAAIKHFLRLIMAPSLYIGGIGVILTSIFKEARWGFLLLVFLIPQPNIWHKLYSLPYGKDFIDFLFMSIVLGIFIQKKGFGKTTNSCLVMFYVIFTYLALWNSSMNFNLPLPISFTNPQVVNFKNYAQMMLLYFLAANVLENEEQHKLIIVIICVVILLISVRSFRNFSGGASFDYAKRVAGPFWRVGLGANHCGAFIIDYCAVLLGILFFDHDKRRRILILTTLLFGLHPFFFAYSRGVYMAAVVVLLFFGFFKKKSLIIMLMALLIFWQIVLPVSVVDRILMTKEKDGQIEHSAGGRLELWMMAYMLFEQNPIIGVGYDGYAMTYGGTEIASGEQLSEHPDVHNFYMRALCEHGIIGLVFFLILLTSAFRSGWKLLLVAKTPFYKGLGFGFMGCVISVAITNLFGDRWSYFVLGGYFWVLFGIVDRSIIISLEKSGKVTV